MAEEQKKEEQKEVAAPNRGVILFISVILQILIIAGLVYLCKYSPIKSYWYLLLMSVVPIILLVDFLIIYFWWAPNNLFFAFISEGLAKIIIRSDQFRRAIINWQGHILVTPENINHHPNKELGDVVDGSPRKRFLGGLYFYGWWPFDDIYIYPFSWTSVKQNGVKVDHLKEILDYVMLKEDVYFCSVLSAEDKLLIPANIDLVLTIRIINPYKALFNVQDWLEAVLNRVRAAVRNAYTESSYEEWISSEKDLGKRIFEHLGKFLTEECQGRYGVEVRALEVIKIDPEKEFRQATTKKFLGEREAERIAGEISYTVVSMMASIEGITSKEMQNKIVSDEKLKTKYQNYCLKRFIDKMAAESGSWVKIDASAGTGMKKDLIEIFAGLLRMPQGNKKKPEEKEKTEDEKKKITDNASKENS